MCFPGFCLSVLFSPQFDTNLIPEAVHLYDALGVKKAPLTLIPPKFEAPLPPLQPAVYPPLLRWVARAAPSPPASQRPNPWWHRLCAALQRVLPSPRVARRSPGPPALGCSRDNALLLSLTRSRLRARSELLRG